MRPSAPEADCVGFQLPDSDTVDAVLRRVRDPRRDRWLAQVERAGGCSRPVRLRARVWRGGRLVYSTEAEPDGALLVRCRNRRAACCPACAHEYRGDMWQLVYAGLAGGRKGVPEGVRHHPQAFVTLTAPGVGAVHTRPDGGRPCPCGVRHEDDDQLLGCPLDPEGYDYEGAVIWNWHAPELWRRFVIALRRALARRLGLTEAEAERELRVSYAKVAEFQARGLVHFHAVVRLDSTDPHEAPRRCVSTSLLCAAIAEAAGHARLAVADSNGEQVTFRFGRQLHVRPLAGPAEDEPVSAEAVAAYVAKYSAKGSHERITGRRVDPEALRERGVPEHLVRMAAACFSLADRPALEGIGRWAHALGFRGHFVTKSRWYSTTLGALRAARARYRRGDVRVETEESTPVIGEWSYLGSGFASAGDALLAAAVAADLRERREAVRMERWRAQAEARR
jgi:hypothetical protein